MGPSPSRGLRHLSAQVSGQGLGTSRGAPTQAAPVVRPQQQCGAGCDLAFEFAIWGPRGLLSSKDNRGFLDYPPPPTPAPKYFAIRSFEVLLSPSPRGDGLSPAGVRAQGGEGAAWRLSRAGRSNRAPAACHGKPVGPGPSTWPPAPAFQRGFREVPRRARQDPGPPPRSAPRAGPDAAEM